MGPEDKTCHFVRESGLETELSTCGAPARWLTGDGKLLCYEHKDDLQTEQPNLRVEPISD